MSSQRKPGRPGKSRAAVPLPSVNAMKAEMLAELDMGMDLPSPLDVTPPPVSVKGPAKAKSANWGKKPSSHLAIVKGNWSAEEDGRLAQLVEQYIDSAGAGRGDRKSLTTRWSEIAKQLPGRVGKQCRERWHNHLRPDINKGRWSFSEEIVIFVCWKNWGSQWARIARLLKNRSDNRVKNHWNCHMKRRLQRDQPYLNFMSQGFAYLSNIRVPGGTDEEGDDNDFQQALLPHVEQYLHDHMEDMDQLPFFVPSSRKERNTFQSVSSTDLNNTEFIGHTPPSRKPAKKTKKTKKRHCLPAPDHLGMVHRMWSDSEVHLEAQQEFDEENHFFNVGPYSQPAMHLSSVEQYCIKPESDLMCSMESTMHPMEYHQSIDNNPFHYSPYRPLDLEPGTVGEDMMRTLSNSCDPLLSKAAMAEFHCSPRFVQRAVTSTPLKQTSNCNVPLTGDCGYSPLNNVRMFGSQEDPAYMSPIRRCYSQCSTVDMRDPSMWTPIKDAMGVDLRGEEAEMNWTPVKLGKLIDTPQPIREALARCDSSRRTISPDEQESPNRLFSDASALIDEEMNQSSDLSRCHSRLDYSDYKNIRPHTLLHTPENALTKCRRRLTDQWGTPSSTSGSFVSSGYGSSFHLTPI